MKSSFFRFQVIFALILSSVIYSGCRENTLISSRLAPSNNTLGLVADTLYTCITHTYYENDNYTSTNLSGIAIYQAVGSLADSFFGTTSGATYFQIANPIPGSIFDSSYHIDSVELVLPYSGFSYGDTADASITQTYQVFYLGDTLGYYTPYFSYSDKPLDVGNPLSSPVTVNLHKLQDSVVVNGVGYCPGMHIKLNTNITMAHLNAAMAASSSTLTSDPAGAFINAFKGICVRPADYRIFSKAIPYFRLDPLGSDAYSQAGLVVYYRNPSATGSDTENTYVFSYNQAGCANFNGLTKSFAKFPVNNLFHSTQVNDSVVALQNMPGACIDIKIGGLTHIGGATNFLRDHVINQAQLQISLINSPVNFTQYAAPEQLYPVGIGNGTYPTGITAGLTYEVQDRLPEGSLSPYYVLDGTSHIYSYGSTNITAYTLGLPREVISCIAANNDTLHLHLHGTQIIYGAYRMLAGGGNYPDNRYKAKLIVVHSSLK